jgi:aspartate-semialdehyde dehydrogenase
MTVGKKVAVVGATGVVGREMLKVLHERRFPVSAIVPIASERSSGKKARFGDQELDIVPLTAAVFEDVDFALFSAGAAISREWGPVAAKAGAIVIDNSSAFRMDADVPLVVPECNADQAHSAPRGIIANPNCSTIQMVVALKPIHDEARITRVVVSTYQAVSGAGADAVACLAAQAESLCRAEPIEPGVLGGQLAGNLLMHWSPDLASGYQEEELKMVHETRKILGDPTIRVSPTAVRVPVAISHSESIAIETERPITAARARELLEKAKGVEVVDDFGAGLYPTPVAAAGRDPVYVGRIREDLGNPGGLLMWVVSDNLRKGAALNAVQIAETLLD